MYELIVLSLLMYGPIHGYLISKITGDIMGPWTKVSPGTLYPVLARLESGGYIKSISGDRSPSEGSRQSHTYEITQGGRMRFHQLMMDTTSNPGDYQRQFRLKVPYMEFIEPEERLLLYNHYINYCETAVMYQKSEANDLLQVWETLQHQDLPYKTSWNHISAAVDLMRHCAAQWQTEADWATCARELLLADIGNNQQTEGGNKYS